MKRRKFFLTVIADGLFVLGLAAIAVGIAMAGHLPAAVCVAGAESTLTGVLLQLSGGRGEDH